MMRGMLGLPMKSRLSVRYTALAVGVVALAFSVLSVLAADEEKVVEARLEGFTRGVKVEGGTLGTWFLFVILAALCVSVLFKNAKRSHMD